MVVEDPQRIAEIAREAVRRARQSDGVVIAAGGDGTINAVAQATLGSACAFGVLPQGTFNYWARTHGIPAGIDEALQILLLEDREACKAQFGRSRLVAFGAGLATLLRGDRNLRLRIEVQGAERDVRTPTLFIGNNALQMEQLGFAEANAIDAGQLAGIMLKPVSRFAMLGLLMRGAFGQLGAADNVVKFAFRNLTVQHPHGVGVRRVKVATVGEISWQTFPLKLRVSPDPLLLIRPVTPAPERNNA